MANTPVATPVMGTHKLPPVTTGRLASESSMTPMQLPVSYSAQPVALTRPRLGGAGAGTGLAHQHGFPPRAPSAPPYLGYPEDSVASALGAQVAAWPHGAASIGRGKAGAQATPASAKVGEGAAYLWATRSETSAAFHGATLRGLGTPTTVSSGPLLPSFTPKGGEMVEIASTGTHRLGTTTAWQDATPAGAITIDAAGVNLSRAWQELSLASMAAYAGTLAHEMSGEIVSHEQKALAPETLKQHHHLSETDVVRLYRALRVYTLGFHETVLDIANVAKHRAPLLQSVWKLFVSLWNSALNVHFDADVLHVAQERDHALEISAQVQSELDEKMKECLHLRDALEKLTKQLLAHVEAKRVQEETISHLEGQVGEARAQIETERAATAEQISMREATEKRLADAQLELQKTLETMRLLEKKAQQAETDRQASAALLQEAQEHVEYLKEQLVEGQGNLGLARKEAFEYRAKYNEEARLRKIAEEENSELRKANLLLSGSVQKLRTDKMQLERKVEALEKMIAELAKELDSVREQMNVIEKELEVERARSADLESKLEAETELRKQRERELAEANENIARLEAELEKERSASTVLRGQLERKREKKKAYKAQLIEEWRLHAQLKEDYSTLDGDMNMVLNMHATRMAKVGNIVNKLSSHMGASLDMQLKAQKNLLEAERKRGQGNPERIRRYQTQIDEAGTRNTNLNSAIDEMLKPLEGMMKRPSSVPIRPDSAGTADNEEKTGSVLLNKTRSRKSAVAQVLAEKNANLADEGRDEALQDDTINALDSAIEAMFDSSNILKEEAEHTNELADRARQAMEDSYKAYARAQEKIHSLEGIKMEMMQRVAELEGGAKQYIEQIANLKASLEEKDNQIKELEEKLAKTQADLEEALMIIEERNQEIVDLKKRIEELEEELADIKRQRDALDSKANGAAEKLAALTFKFGMERQAKEEERKAKELLTGEVASLKAKLAQALASSKWRDALSSSIQDKMKSDALKREDEDAMKIEALEKQLKEALDLLAEREGELEQLRLRVEQLTAQASDSTTIIEGLERERDGLKRWIGDVSSTLRRHATMNNEHGETLEQDSKTVLDSQAMVSSEVLKTFEEGEVLHEDSELLKSVANEWTREVETSASEESVDASEGEQDAPKNDAEGAADGEQNADLVAPNQAIEEFERASKRMSRGLKRARGITLIVADGSKVGTKVISELIERLKKAFEAYRLLEEERGKNAECEKRIAELEMQLLNEQNALKLSEEGKRDVQDELERLRLAFGQGAETISQLEENLKLMNQRNRAAMKCIEGMENLFETKVLNRAAELEGLFEKFLAMIDNHSDSAEKMKNNLDELDVGTTNHFDSTSNHVKEIYTAGRHLVGEIHKLQRVREMLEADVKRLENDIDGLTKDTKGAKEIMAEMNARIRELEAQLEKLQLEMENAIATRDDAIAERDETISQMEAKIAALQAALDEKIAEYEEAQKEAQKVIATKDAHISELQRDISERDATIADLHAQVEDLTLKLKLLQDRYDNDLRGAQDSLQVIHELEARIEKLEMEKLDTARHHEKELAELRAAHEQELAKRDDEMAALRESHKAEVAELNAKHESEVAELNAKHKSEVDALQQKIDELSTNVRDLKEELGIRTAELSKTQVELAKALSEIERLKKAVADLEKQLADLRAQLEREREEAAKAMEDALEAWNKEREMLQEEMERLRDQLKQRQTTLKNRWTGTIIRMDANYLSMDDERDIKVSYGLDTLELLISQIYHEKILADIADDHDNDSTRQFLDEFVLDYMTFKFGVRVVAERHLASLFEAIEHYAGESVKVRMFGSLCGHPKCPAVEPHAIHTHLYFLAHAWRRGIPESEFSKARTLVDFEDLSLALSETLAEFAEPKLMESTIHNLLLLQVPSEDGSGAVVDLDLAAQVILDLWNDMYTEYTKTVRQRFMDADENNDGVLTFAEFQRVVTMLRPQTKEREAKVLFRLAQRRCANGNTIDFDAFATLALDSILAFLPVREPPIVRGRENYVEKRLLEDSWTAFMPVVNNTIEHLAEEDEKRNIRLAMDSINGHLADGTGFHVRFAGAGAEELAGGQKHGETPAGRVGSPAWVMYRRCLLLHYVHRERIVVKMNEQRRATDGSSAFSTKFHDWS